MKKIADTFMEIIEGKTDFSKITRKLFLIMGIVVFVWIFLIFALGGISGVIKSVMELF